ncbi:MAG: nucleoside-diphosphate sugar epimerase/dehydratase, partial [Thermoanaerobaculia bacterium]
IQLPLVVLLQFGVVLLLGIYSFVWRYIGMAEVMAFVRAAVYSAVPLLILRLGLPAQFASWRVPISIILMDTVFAFGGLLGLRVLRRAIYERYERTQREKTNGNGRHKPVLLVGAGRAGVMAVKEIHGRGDMDLEIVGFVDDDPLKQRTVIQGVKVLGTTRDLPDLVRTHGIDRVVITLSEVDRQTIRSIVEICERCRVRTQIIPGFYEILDGSVAVSRFRDVQIEDLLGREPVRLDEDELRRFLTGKSVMVTGAGGSIGSELCRQIARFNPLHLFLVERAEGALFEIERELLELWPGLSIEALVADVGDGIRMRKILEERHPHVILHAAAHKHVPMMEKHPGEAVRNNILATSSLGQMAGQAGVQAFVLISTDKAVCPTSVMGASKRVAELVIQDLDKRFKKSRFLAVRFGNVMGSAGSVIPIFRRQIERGGPVTVTHPEVMRYFMTPAEATQLVLEAGALGEGGEIMVLDMGRPIKILDLATDMINLSGYKPFEEIPISFTGLRPGEKLFEELELSGEA